MHRVIFSLEHPTALILHVDPLRQDADELFIAAIDLQFPANVLRNVFVFGPDRFHC